MFNSTVGSPLRNAPAKDTEGRVKEDVEITCALVGRIELVREGGALFWVLLLAIDNCFILTKVSLDQHFFSL